MDNEVLKVSGQSSPKLVAGAIASVVRRDGGVSVQAVGAGAVNQAVKAIAIARDYVAPNGIDLVSMPAFFKIDTDDGIKTGIRFFLEPRAPQP
ncbi:MAG: stage V sporulation protein S [Armatimonadetes bacterium]|nr:stage V sporulation protein S [Armatimonadota bacterium]